MARFAAVLDACVMVPIALSDTLLRLADRELYRPVWSDRILAEARRAVRRVHPTMDQARIDARFHAMDAAFDDACVSGWEPLVHGIVLPDPDDRHVVAAALRAHAGVIVTANVRDFPRETLGPLGLHVLSPDAFLLDHLELDPEGTITIVVQQAADHRRPPVTVSHVLNSLTKAGAPEFAAAAGALLRARSTRDEDDRPSG